MKQLLSVIVLASLIFSQKALAQETPTEREAAKDVLQKMNSLERSLETETWVKRMMAPSAARDQVVARAKELMDKELIAMGDEITKHPEVGFQEKWAVEKLTAYLRQHNFDVKVGVAGLETAFVGRFKGNNGAPNLGVILEYDALRGTKGAFHGDQHSTQGPIGIAAAVAMAEYLEKTHTPGSVVVFGTPAEEMMLPAKIDMHKAGVFNGIDLMVRSHSVSSTARPAPGFGTCCLNIDGVKYIFSGAPAHQMTPWNGRNALEAVIQLFNNIDAMRSTMRPEARVQGVILEGGTAPNVVPDRAVADFYIRYPDSEYLAQVREMVDNAARAAALATGTKVKIEPDGNLRDGISVSTLDELGFEYLKKYGATHVEAAPGKPMGYEETGSVSSDIPGVEFSAQTSTAPNHTYEMESDTLAEIGHKGFVTDAEAMAATMFDFATHADYRAAVKREFEGIKALKAEYQNSLKKAYEPPIVRDPK